MNKRNLIRKLFLWGLCFGSLYQIGQASQAESQPAQHLQKELPHLALLKGKDSKTRDRLSKDQLTEILDPSYDATFKLLFKDSEKIGGHTGPERCKAFLNSIFYPGIDEEGFRIKELKMIDNERTKLGEVRGKKTRRLDIACQCTCWKGTDKPRNGKHVEKFDLEMQRTYDSNFMDRIESYGEDLREKKSMVSVKVLALYNFLENKEIPSVISKRVLKTLDTGKDQETRKGEPVIYLINLADQVKKMEAGEAIMIENKKLGEKGELWFALLGIRQWQENRKKNTVFPIVFKTEGFESQEFRSALELLKVKNKNENAYKDLIDSMRREDGEYEGALEIAREQIMEEITAMNNVKAAMARFMERDGKFFKGESIKAKKYVESYDQIQIEKKASLKELWQEVLDRRYANPDPNEEVDEDEEAISEKELEKQRKKFVVDGVFYEFFMKKVTAAVAISS